MTEEAVGFPPASELRQRLPASDSWKCVRCGTPLPSPGDGRPPVSCLEDLGGCGRSSDDDANHTRFFPEDWGTAKVQLYIDAELDEGQRLFRDVQDAIRAHYYLERAWHYVIVTLFVFQAYVTASLPVVFYLPVAGPKGTGKTNLLSFIAALTGALQFENVSIAAMARTMRFGRTVTMDELDTDRGKEANEIRDSLLRSGYKRNAPAYVRWDAARKVSEEIHVFGPRAFGYRGALEDALQDRGFPIPSVKPIGPSGYDYVLANFWPELADLPARLRAWGDGAKVKFPEERLRDIAHSDAFRQKVRAAVQVLGANRDSELVTVALLVAEMAGVDVISALSEAGKLREVETSSASDLDMEDFKDALLEVAGPIHEQAVIDAELAVSPTVRVKQSAVRRRFDEKRKLRGERHLGHSGFAKLRRDTIKDDWLGSHARAVFWDVPVPVLVALVEIDRPPPMTSPYSPSSPVPIQEWGEQGEQGEDIRRAHSTATTEKGPSGGPNRILGPLEGVHPCDLCGSRATWKVISGIWLKASCTECLPKFGIAPPEGST